MEIYRIRSIEMSPYGEKSNIWCDSIRDIEVARVSARRIKQANPYRVVLIERKPFTFVKEWSEIFVEEIK